MNQGENPMNDNAQPPATGNTASPTSSSSPTFRTVSAGSGITWIADAFDLFRQRAGMWILIVVVMAIIFIVLSLLGPLAIILNLLAPILLGGLMLGCSAQQQGQELEFNYLFAGFQRHGGALAAVGALYLAGSFVVIVVAAVTALLTGASSGLMALIGGHSDVAALAGIGVSLLIALLVALAVSIPLAMAIWFAPALVVLEQQTAVDAMKLSFQACLHNILPFLLWGVVMLVLSIIGVLTLGLGFLIIAPVQIISMYTAYQDIFGSD